MANPTCKLNQAQLSALRHQYELGEFTTLTDLANQFGIKVQALHARIKRHKWFEKRQELVLKSDKVVEKIVVDEAKRWTDKVKQRTEKDWNIIDQSMDNLAGSTGEVDPDTMLTSARARKILDDMHRRSIGMVEPSQQVSVTHDIGTSLVQAIAKLRQENSAVEVTMQQAEQLAEYEIVKTNPSNGKPK